MGAVGFCSSAHRQFIGNREFHFSGQEWDMEDIWKTSTQYYPVSNFFQKLCSLISQSQPQLSFSQGDTQGLQQRQRHALMFGSRAHLLGTQHPTGGLLSQGPQGGDIGWGLRCRKGATVDQQHLMLTLRIRENLGHVL